MLSARSGPSSSATTRNGSWSVTTIAHRGRSGRSYWQRREQDGKLSREPGPLQKPASARLNRRVVPETASGRLALRHLDAQQPLLQPTDLVPQRRRALELELARRRPHLAAQ